jgi:YspA, cpYpsA-related SLOG family
MERYILVAGGSYWPYPQKLTAHLDQVLAGVPSHDVLVVVHGGGTGAELHAQRWVYKQRDRREKAQATHPEVREQAYQPAGPGERAMTEKAVRMVLENGRLELALVTLWDDDPDTLAVLRTLRAERVNATVLIMYSRRYQQEAELSGHGPVPATGA